MLKENIAASIDPDIQAIDSSQESLVAGGLGNDSPIPDMHWKQYEPLVEAHGLESTPLWRDIAERLIALVALIFLLPIIVVLAILVKLDSPGPVLFRQWRVGLGGRVFRFTKFRTYLADAKQRFPELYSYSYSPEDLDGLHFKVPNDPRMTRLGAFLRKSTLDELPNFWHVLTGEMSLIGPRPEIPEMLPYYTKAELQKFTVRPGISGQAQISGRGLLDFRSTVAADVMYVQQRSLLGDIRIALLTIYKVFLRQGAF